jgi:hypothetical protein
MREIAREAWAWRLLESHSQELWLSVVCGTVGLYEINLQLSFEERNRYMESGIAAIAALAADICSRPSSYAHRHDPSMVEQAVQPDRP